MGDVRDEQETITQFLVNTCGLCHQLDMDAVCLHALSQCALITCTSSVDSKSEVIAVTTGSIADFNIEPMLSCIADQDIMYHLSDQLATPAGTAPPIDLPGEFHSRVEVYEIVDSEFPGYVYLVSSYLLTESIDDGKYNAVLCDRCYRTYEADDGRHGPAIVTRWTYATPPSFGRIGGSSHSRDFVSCVLSVVAATSC